LGWSVRASYPDRVRTRADLPPVDRPHPTFGQHKLVSTSKSAAQHHNDEACPNRVSIVTRLKQREVFTRRHAFVGEPHQAALTRERVLETAGRCRANYATQCSPEPGWCSLRSRLSTQVSDRRFMGQFVLPARFLLTPTGRAGTSKLNSSQVHSRRPRSMATLHGDQVDRGAVGLPATGRQ